MDRKWGAWMGLRVVLGEGGGREGYDTRSVASGWLAEQCLSIERESEGCINDMMPDGIF